MGLIGILVMVGFVFGCLGVGVYYGAEWLVGDSCWC